MKTLMIFFLKNIFSFKCPRCHEGELFVNKWYNFSNGNKMVECCSVCGQRTELEPGFYHGTGSHEKQPLNVLFTQYILALRKI